MKSIIILGDGMSDEPLPDHGGQTPLMMARKPSIDRIAREGRMGRLAPSPTASAPARTWPTSPCSATTRRSSRTAAPCSRPPAWASTWPRTTSPCAATSSAPATASSGTTPRATSRPRRPRLIIRDLEATFGAEGSRCRCASTRASATATCSCCTAPGRSRRRLHAAARPRRRGRRRPAAARHVARGRARRERRLRELIAAARPILADHPVNRARVAAGKTTADSIWPWSPGRRPRMETLQQRFGVQGRRHLRRRPGDGPGRLRRHGPHPRPGRHRPARHQLRGQGPGGPRRPGRPRLRLRPRRGHRRGRPRPRPRAQDQVHRVPGRSA